MCECVRDVMEGENHKNLNSQNSIISINMFGNLILFIRNISHLDKHSQNLRKMELATQKRGPLPDQQRGGGLALPKKKLQILQ